MGGFEMAKVHRLAAACLLATTVLAPAIAAAPVAADGGTRQIQSSGTVVPTAAPTALVDGIAVHEFRLDPDALRNGEAPASGPALKNVRFGRVGAEAQPDTHSTPASNQRLSFNGLTVRQQRLANNGNQFTVEPPDQGLCVGNGFVLETVNDVMRVFDTSGHAVSGVVDLNSFYGYAPQLDRTTNLQGPFVTDPSCLYDTATQRWFHLVLTLEVFPDTGDFTGQNHVDLAVSTTSNPTGAWTIYHVDVTDDGSNGTPNHNCQPGPPPQPDHHAPTYPNACIGDFPHLGADANGIYLTTNEYWLFGHPTPTNAAAFHAAQIYAFSKHQLVSGARPVSVTQIDTLGLLNSQPGFTVWPAVSPSDADYEHGRNGTEYFTSTNASEEASNVPNSRGINASNQLAVWALSNTASLADATPSLRLQNTTVRVTRYSVPPPSNQKRGRTPLKDCLNDTTTPTPFGPGCWQIFFVAEPAHDEVEGPLDSSDSRVLSNVFAGGRLWGTLDTGVMVDRQKKAAVQYYVVRPELAGGRLSANLERQGRVMVPNNNTIYGAVGVTHDGRALLDFTLVGADHYPTAAYVSLNSRVAPDKIHIAAAGLGPQDGFTEYNAFGTGTPPVAGQRWGDYGAAVASGNTIWLANEYTGQTCNYRQYYPGRNATPPDLTDFGSCGGTRVSLGNWYTRLTAVDVSRRASDETDTQTGDNVN
jgi:hypothetical protein